MHTYDYKAKITVADLELRFNKGYGKYDPSRCGESMPGAGYSPIQCANKAKPGSLWCGIHSPEAEAKRQEKRDALYNEKMAKSSLQWMQREGRDKLADIAPELAAMLEQLQEAVMGRGPLGESLSESASLLERYRKIAGVRE